MSGLLGLLVLLVLVIFLLSNRDPAGLQFWPFGYVLAVPLGVIVLVVLVFGFLAGWLFHLPRRIGAGRRAKRAEKRAAALEAQLPPPPAVVP